MQPTPARFLNERIKQLRRQKKLSQREFAGIIGVSRSFLSQVESGTTKPSIEAIVGIAREFPDVNLAWFLVDREGLEEEAGAGHSIDYVTVNKSAVEVALDVLGRMLKLAKSEPPKDAQAAMFIMICHLYNNTFSSYKNSGASETVAHRDARQMCLSAYREFRRPEPNEGVSS